MAKHYVTVALTGDGGDEVFGGYNRYLWHGRAWNMMQRSPRFVSTGMGRAITFLSPAMWDGLLKLASPVMPSSALQRLGGQKLHKFANIVRARNERDLYRQVSSVWPFPQELMANGYRELTGDDLPMACGASDFIEEMMYLDTVSYLPDDIFVKVDRASMGASLETRAPFVDHEIIEFAWSLPLSMKIRHGMGKYVVRKVLEKFVPPRLTDRPKAGFGIPLGTWLRGELREWAEEMLDPARMAAQGYLDVKTVQKKWEEHLSGRRDWEFQMWNILMWQAWLERQPSASTALVSA
jgi:asparagine synthase (glutamine-hydrolysing)